MKTAISYSGGKDSTALLLYAIEILGKDNFVAVYQDTGFEHSSHYEYINYIESALDIKIERIKSKKYDGMIDLIKKRKTLPGNRIRFCTEELKLKPFKEWLKKNNDVDTVWLGIRAEESRARSDRYSDLTDGFPLTMYPVFKNKCFSHITCYVPLVDWSEQDVWDMHDKYKIKPNPQYAHGAKRVGCYPCLMGSHHGWATAWKTEEGKANIIKLAEMEDYVSRERGKNCTIKKDKQVRDFIKMMEVQDLQDDLFEVENEIQCSWCQS